MARFYGIPAAAGLAAGKVLVLCEGGDEPIYASGTTTEELWRFRSAAERSEQQLRDLARGLDADAAAILEFQSELLNDPDFLATPIDAIYAGKTAIDAWRHATDDELAQYRSGSSEYLSARADDLVDLKARVERNILGLGDRAGRAPDGAVLIADLLTPSRFLELDPDAIAGIATARGSPTSHVCIMARARAIPMVVGCGDGLIDVTEGTEVVLDAELGVLISDAGIAELDAFKRRLADRSALLRAADADKANPAVTAEGERIRIYANVDDPRLLEGIDAAPFDGVGLVRTEFLFEGGAHPSEDQQYQSYCRVLEWADGRPVTIRVLDAGGDKPIAGLTLPDEENPFLGVRGIRLFQYRPETFRTQLRALARAAVRGDLRMMVPMVSIPREMAEFRAEMSTVVSDLEASGVSCRMPPIGMMVEVPSAALMASDFNTDFYSIGTNDLTQYALAAARDEYRLNGLVRDGTGAISKLIEMVVEAGRRKNVEVSVCGDMASLPDQVGVLLQSGARSLSLAPATVAMIKEKVRGWAARSDGE